eukprot:scaffold183711_cov31-Attheya_sp.AAC.1
MTPIGKLNTRETELECMAGVLAASTETPHLYRSVPLIRIASQHAPIRRIVSDRPFFVSPKRKRDTMRSTTLLHSSSSSNRPVLASAPTSCQPPRDKGAFQQASAIKGERGLFKG